MRTEVAHVGMKVRQEHRILARRGMVGSYREEENVVVDVRFSDRSRWLFWPEDLEEVTSPARGPFADRRWRKPTPR
jgi:hypothetical protein